MKKADLIKEVQKLNLNLFSRVFDNAFATENMAKLRRAEENIEKLTTEKGKLLRNYERLVGEKDLLDERWNSLKIKYAELYNKINLEKLDDRESDLKEVIVSQALEILNLRKEDK